MSDRQQPASCYLVCTTPRSGSSLLCALLDATGVAGMRPAPRVGHEYFLEVVGDRSTTVDRDRHLAAGVEHYVGNVFERSRRDNDVAGFKVMWAQWVKIAELHAAGTETGPRFPGREVAAARRLLPEGTRFVWLRRRDRLRQAISLVKALQSQCWNSVQQSRFHGGCFFDYVGIRRAMRMYERQDRAWRAFFDRLGVAPLEIAYEDLVDDRDGELQRAIAFLGLPVTDASVLEAPHERQSDALNERWVEKYERVLALPSPVRAAYLGGALPLWIGSRSLQAWRVWRRRRRIAAAAVWDGRGARPV